MDTGLDFAAIRAELDGEDWEDDPDNPGSQIRRVLLGSIFSLTPSGKFYLPFACSNVDPCPRCAGHGSVSHVSARVAKRSAARSQRLLRRARRWAAAGDRWSTPRMRRNQAMMNRLSGRTCAQCPLCHGVGSHEAYLDECWNEALELGLGEIGAWADHYSGDIFAAECRDAPEDEDDEDDEDDEELFVVVDDA